MKRYRKNPLKYQNERTEKSRDQGVKLKVDSPIPLYRRGRNSKKS